MPGRGAAAARGEPSAPGRAGPRAAQGGVAGRGGGAPGYGPAGPGLGLRRPAGGRQVMRPPISRGRPFVRLCMVTTYDLVHVGSRVRVRDLDGDAEFTIVGPEDSDVA